MNFLGLEAFLAIVQARSLTKAAEMLYLSQSTLSYRLKVLEREVGATLIERSKGMQNISLTPFGKTFVTLAERWSLLQRDLEILQSGIQQINIKISAVDSLNVYVLPPLYRAISKQWPSINLEFRTQHSSDSYESIENKDVDIAFVKMERTVPGIIVEPFYVDEMVLVRLAAPDRLPGATISVTELDWEHQLYCNWGPSYQTWHKHWWDSPPHFEVDSVGLIFSLMWDLRQWAIIPTMFASSFIKTDNFVIQKLSDPPPPRVCYKLTSKNPDPIKATAIDLINQLVHQTYAVSSLSALKDVSKFQ